MIIRKATSKDIDQIVTIYDHIHDEEEAGEVTIGWKRAIYPTKKTAEESFGRDDLFVMEGEGVIVASAIINQIQVPEYRFAEWKYKTSDDKVMVLHTLTVDPFLRDKGYGKAFVAFYEEYARKHNCCYLRLDTNFINDRARKMYARLGYEEIGVVNCVFNGIEGVRLVCLEKYIRDIEED